MNGTDMRSSMPPRDVRSALQRLQDEPHEPLMSTEDITSLLSTSTAIPSTPRSITKPPSSATPIVASIGLAALSVAAVLLVAPISEHVDVIPRQDVTPSQHAIVNESGVFDHADTTSTSPNHVARTAEPEDIIGTWSPDTETLARLGITVAHGRLSYIEGSTLVSVRTSGIVSQQAKQQSTAIAPRFVSLYHGSTLAFSWFDRRSIKQSDIPQQTPAETTPQLLQAKSLAVGRVNDMICVRVDLADPNNTFFPTATALLWFDPVDDVVHNLPEQLRSNLTRQLINEGSLVERRTQSDLVQESSVYPNPSPTPVSTLSITLKEPTVATIEAYDALGNLLTTLHQSLFLSQGRNDVQVKLDPSTPSGMVILVVRFEASTQRIVHRLLIQR
jgi:hypothetical protein